MLPLEEKNDFIIYAYFKIYMFPQRLKLTCSEMYVGNIKYNS